MLPIFPAGRDAARDTRPPRSTVRQVLSMLLFFLLLIIIPVVVIQLWGSP